MHDATIKTMISVCMPKIPYVCNVYLCASNITMDWNQFRWSIIFSQDSLKNIHESYYDSVKIEDK